MSHEEYWKGVWDDAHERLDRLFDGCGCKVSDIVGDGNCIDCFGDAKMVLAHALQCADDCHEKACAILSVAEALHALDELKERSEAR